MATIMNLTPHTLNLKAIDGRMVDIPPSGQVARCTETSVQVGEIELEGGVVLSKKRKTYGEVYDLPDPQEGVIYCVSFRVAQAVPDREDVVFPGDLIRDEEGKPIGADGTSVL